MITALTQRENVTVQLLLGEKLCRAYRTYRACAKGAHSGTPPLCSRIISVKADFRFVK